MNDDYLWDKTGRDDEVERLEKLLRPLAHKPRALPRRGVRARPLAAVLLSAAAALLVAALWFLPRETPAPPRAAAHTIDLGRYGRVDVEPNSRVKVVKKDEELIKLRLDLGTIHAQITLDARPRLFQVETPATTCVDLGCHYTLTVDEAGRSMVRVSSGRVAFLDAGREVYVPRGAACRAAPSRGSGTPVYENAPAALVEAVRAFDDAAPSGRPAAARLVIERAVGPKDTLPLWHLLWDADPAVAGPAFDALAKLEPPPEDVTREAVLGRNKDALEAWKERLVDHHWLW